MRATSRASKLSIRKPSAAEAASPASFHPLKAQMRAGLRSSGRSRHSTWSIQVHGTEIPLGAHPIVRSGAEDWAMPVAQLRTGGPIEGVFACTRKDRMTARNGSTYLALELRDRTGAIPARAFRDADFLAGRFDRGDLVQVSGRV